MSADKVIGSMLIAIVPAAFVLYGLVAFAIVALRKLPDDKKKKTSERPPPSSKEPRSRPPRR
jgi:hypothetical protein